VDPTGAPGATRGYTPFGEIHETAGSAASSYGFAGEWIDSTGLIHLRARYYAPAVGRFVSRDTWQGRPLQPITQNRYVYANGSPANYVDPSGHWCFLGNNVYPECWRPCTTEQIEHWGNLEKAIGLTIGGISERSNLTGLSPTTEFLAEAFLLFSANLWDTPFVQTPIAHRDVLFGSDSTFLERLLPAINVWFSTGQPVTEYFLLPLVLAWQLDVPVYEVSAGRLALSREEAEYYLVRNGWQPRTAADYVSSFSTGQPIKTRIVGAGETWWRYTDHPEYAGSFLTRTLFDNADDAVAALRLGPYANQATFLQAVTASEATVVFEGGINGGWPWVSQTMIVDRSAFNYGPGVLFRR